MITATTYLRPDITLETELVGSKKFYIYNYQGIHYRVFKSLKDADNFISNPSEGSIFECNTESELEGFLNHEKID